MSTTIEKTKSDLELKNDILSELQYEPGVKSTDIGVMVESGIVTLKGHVYSLWEKSEAIHAVKRVEGIKAIADDMEVQFNPPIHCNDTSIAADVTKQLELSPSIPKNTVKVMVRDGLVTLEGDVEWWYQKNAAENAVTYLKGVKEVKNLITIKPQLSSAGIVEAIQSAFKRSAVLDADQIHVTTSGNAVTLKGKVRNYAEEEEAERTAWAAPGVSSVDNQLTRGNWL